MLKNFLILAVLGLLLFLLIQPKNTDLGKIEIKHDTIWKDTIITNWKKGKNIPYIVLDTQWIDTSKVVLKDTFCKKIKVYSDTFRIDSSFVTLKDTIKGELLGRSYTAFLHEKTIITEKTITKPDKNSIYIGGVASPQYIGVGVFYKKDRQLIGLSLNSNQTINLSYYVKIH